MFPSKFGFRSVLAPCLASDIAEAEEELGMDFPLEYRAFLEEWNGGIFAFFPEGDDFEAYPAVPFLNNDTEYGIVASLYGVGPKRNESHILAHENREGYDFVERVPNNIVAIGEYQGAHLLCISMAGDDCGHIYYWRPGVDWEEDGNVQTCKFLNLVAKDFTECWEKLFVPRGEIAN